MIKNCTLERWYNIVRHKTLSDQKIQIKMKNQFKSHFFLLKHKLKITDFLTFFKFINYLTNKIDIQNNKKKTECLTLHRKPSRYQVTVIRSVALSFI